MYILKGLSVLVVLEQPVYEKLVDKVELSPELGIRNRNHKTLSQ